MRDSKPSLEEARAKSMKEGLLKFTMFDIALHTKFEGVVQPRDVLRKQVEVAQSTVFAKDWVKKLPGPLSDPQYSGTEGQIDFLQEMQRATSGGYLVYKYAELQKCYGSQGLGSNIVIPLVCDHGMGKAYITNVDLRVLLSHPDDVERISRVHVKKEFNLGMLYDSVISTTDNEHWREQRNHLVEAFLPMASLSKIFPVSAARAKYCAERLLEQSQNGAATVDMNDFYLHEAQAQLQLALLGEDEEFMEATNKGLRATFAGRQEGQGKTFICDTIKAMMYRVSDRHGLASPFEASETGKEVRGPLSRIVATQEESLVTKFGNVFLVLFAGHDTTGNMMTWLTFEMARHPHLQAELQAEVDEFWKIQGDRPVTYADLGDGRLKTMDLFITETLRLWNTVPQGTFRELQFDEEITGPDGKLVQLPKGTKVNMIIWSRHRNPDLWGPDAHVFNPHGRGFTKEEILSVSPQQGAMNPQSARFSPFTHNPRSCLGKNFAQMEIRLILLQVFHKFMFKLAEPYASVTSSPDSTVSDMTAKYRAANHGTLYPMNLLTSNNPECKKTWGERPHVGMHFHAIPRHPQR